MCLRHGKKSLIRKTACCSAAVGARVQAGLCDTETGSPAKVHARAGTERVVLRQSVVHLYTEGWPERLTVALEVGRDARDERQQLCRCHSGLSPCHAAITADRAVRVWSGPVGPCYCATAGCTRRVARWICISKQDGVSWGCHAATGVATAAGRGLSPVSWLSGHLLAGGRRSLAIALTIVRKRAVSSVPCRVCQARHLVSTHRPLHEVDALELGP